MSQTNSLPSDNRLLSTLLPEDLSLLQPKLRRQALKLRCVIEQPGRPVEQVHFLERGLASVVSNAGGDRRAETGMIGREGVTGSCVILGSDLSLVSGRLLGEQDPNCSPRPADAAGCACRTLGHRTSC